VSESVVEEAAAAVSKEQEVIVKLQQENRKLQLDAERERRLAVSYREENDVLQVLLASGVMLGLSWFVMCLWKK
jgi:hypothetical protein